MIHSAPDPVPSSSAVPPHPIIEAREWRAQAGTQRSQMLPARPTAPGTSSGALLTRPVCTQACPWQRRARHGATRCATTCAHTRTSRQPVHCIAARPAAFVHSARGALVWACGRVQCSMCVCAVCSYHISRPGVKATTPALLPIDRDNGEQARTAATRLARQRAATRSLRTPNASSAACEYRSGSCSEVKSLVHIGNQPRERARGMPSGGYALLPRCAYTCFATSTHTHARARAHAHTHTRARAPSCRAAHTRLSPLAAAVLEAHPVFEPRMELALGQCAPPTVCSVTDRSARTTPRSTPGASTGTAWTPQRARAGSANARTFASSCLDYADDDGQRASSARCGHLLCVCVPARARACVLLRAALLRMCNRCVARGGLILAHARWAFVDGM